MKIQDVIDAAKEAFDWGRGHLTIVELVAIFFVGVVVGKLI